MESPPWQDKLSDALHMLSTQHNAEVCNQLMFDMLSRQYSVESAAAGKAAAKAELRKRLSLSNADVPIVAVVTRLTHQKVLSHV